MSTNNSPSQMVVQQRLRNRFMEYWETTSSYDKQRDYQERVPIANVAIETMCAWGDWTGHNDLSYFSEPVFTQAEQAAIAEFHTVWKSVLDATPEHLPELEDLIGTEPWERLRVAAAAALAVFAPRGKFDEEREAFRT